MTKPTYLLVTGSGDPSAIDAYLYGDNARVVTFVDGRRFRTVVAVATTDGFGPGPQADRLASGLYGAYHYGTDFDAALAAAQNAPI